VIAVEWSAAANANYCRRMGATWILVYDPRQVRHVLGVSESPGIVLRSLCDVAAPRADWLNVDEHEIDMPECVACHGLLADAAKRGSRGGTSTVPPVRRGRGQAHFPSLPRRLTRPSGNRQSVRVIVVPEVLPDGSVVGPDGPVFPTHASTAEAQGLQDAYRLGCADSHRDVAGPSALARRCRRVECLGGHRSSVRDGATAGAG
jgi:hypothetical protein